VASTFTECGAWGDFGIYPTIQDDAFLEDDDEYERRRLTRTRYLIHEVDFPMVRPIHSLVTPFLKACMRRGRIDLKDCKSVGSAVTKNDGFKEGSQRGSIRWSKRTRKDWKLQVACEGCKDGTSYWMPLYLGS
jgi:hypothetical protein